VSTWFSELHALYRESSAFHSFRYFLVTVAASVAAIQIIRGIDSAATAGS
jgi:hypothetical protein